LAFTTLQKTKPELIDIVKGDLGKTEPMGQQYVAVLNEHLAKLSALTEMFGAAKTRLLIAAANVYGDTGETRQ